MIFEKLKECVFCKSKSFQRSKTDNAVKNFYLEAIISDLKLQKKQFELIKTYNCKSCNLIFNNPWFKEEISRKIYSSVYGQHHNSWQNLIDFINTRKLPSHGRLFNILNKNIKIKNYAEFNSPFMGLFLNYFNNPSKNNKNLYKSFNKNIIKYLTSRQLAGSTKNQKKQSLYRSGLYLKNINSFKKKYSKISRLNKKILFFDQSSLNWGINDNYKSVNSRAYAQEIFDLDLLDINSYEKKTKLDLFGIFHSLDHTNQPKKLLECALRISDYVIIHCHDVKKVLNNQHMFGFNQDFFKKLSKKEIYTLNLTKKIEIEKTNELYILCSKDQKKIKRFEKKINKNI